VRRDEMRHSVHRRTVCACVWWALLARVGSVSTRLSCRRSTLHIAHLGVSRERCAALKRSDADRGVARRDETRRSLRGPARLSFPWLCCYLSTHEVT